MATYNMNIRLGVDASDFKKKMAQAGMTAESTGQKIKKSLTMSELGSEVRSIMGWGNSSTGISGAIDAGNFEAAKSQLAILKSYRDQLAGAGFDDLQFGEVSERIKLLEFELNAYTESLKTTAEAETEAAGDADTLGRSSEKLKRDVRSMNSELDRTSGSLRKIGPSAKSSTSNIEGLLKSIRRLGIASLAMRFVRGIFGELGTITRQYISENETLQAQVNGLRSAMGSALAPAINIVTNALAALMPYVVGVSNAIGSLLGALGGGWANVAAQANGATKAIKGAGGAQADLKRSLQGFDEITKLNSKSSGGGGGGSSSPTVKVEPITPEWLQEFVDNLKTQIQQQDWGGVAGVIVAGLSEGLGYVLGELGKLAKEKILQPIVSACEKDKEQGVMLGTNLAKQIGAGIADFFRNAKDWVAENIWNPLVEGIGNGLGIDLSKWKIKIPEFSVGVKNDSSTWWSNVKKWWSGRTRSGGSAGTFTTNVKNDSSIWWSNVKKWWSDRTGSAESAGTFTANVKNDSSTWWSNVKKWWSDKVGTVDPFTVEVADDSTLWWEKTKMFWIKSRGVLDIHATIPDEGDSWWRTVESYWNKHAGRLKTKLEIEVPKIKVTWDKSVSPDTRGEIYKPNYTIKYNELGAIFGKASLLGFADGAAQVAGEAGREALLPLDRHTWWMDDIADRVVAKIGGGSSGTDRPIQINLMVDGKVLTSTVVRNVNAQARATGVNPLAAYM